MTDQPDRKNRPYAPRMTTEQRREQMLDAALRVIVRDGVHKVSMDWVSREAGVTRPVIYKVFRDTDELLAASLKREEQAATAQISALDPSGDAGPEQQALAYLDGFLQAVLAAPARWRAIYSLVDASDTSVRGPAITVQSAMLDVYRDVIADIDTDTELLARSLLALTWDAGRTVLAEPDRFPPERISTFAAKLLARWL